MEFLSLDKALPRNFDKWEAKYAPFFGDCVSSISSSGVISLFCCLAEKLKGVKALLTAMFVTFVLSDQCSVARVNSSRMEGGVYMILISKSRG
jgi:hypothetical protein